MTTGSEGSVWSRFEHDPRVPAYHGLRASDRGELSERAEQAEPDEA
ncbi:MAG TPA: hypothetical protein VHW64_01460 [Nocardioides sp.]|nr:hypothetical protein [Nocardioides sp.]HEX3929340.1 hypothetical protein [Nocardioides sp.]